jgi:hypothetical protein
MFFSEEKNQKTFMIAPAYRYGAWPDNGEAAETQKSWLFSSEKNFLPYRPDCVATRRRV